MNRGLELAVAMWALTAFSLTLVVARLYTRRRIVKFVGIEDHMYAWTGVFLLCFTVFIQVAVQHGLGKSFWGLSIAESSDAIFWTYVANSFAITGNAMAKLSMGLFLLRVVQARWQRVVLWLAIAVTSGTSIALVVMLWNQTTPIRTSWDPLRTPGKWNIEIQPMSVMLGVWSSACDFLFAIFPWLFIKELRMPQREKVMLAGGMSLGVIAGACGIVRTVVLSKLDVYNYTCKHLGSRNRVPTLRQVADSYFPVNFVPYFAWAGAEIAVAMICIGIPTLRPLYLKTQQNLASAYARSQRRGRHGRRPSRHSQQLPPFTMVEGPLAEGEATTSRRCCSTTTPSSRRRCATAAKACSSTPPPPPRRGPARTRRRCGPTPADDAVGLDPDADGVGGGGGGAAAGVEAAAGLYARLARHEHDVYRGGGAAAAGGRAGPGEGVLPPPEPPIPTQQGRVDCAGRMAGGGG
ncbi:hypothetical protein PG997_014978 [Apiospora hydei]|uniref:Rhodopsin domain-containing protein n=1 Tax=Apiospora hydei TaxID=1337664 RepID=A0ABR1UVC3_9PEZI